LKKYLIVGLGNVGSEYKNTRHNIGFKILDAFASQKEVAFTTKKLGDVTVYKLKGKQIHLLKPSTYMNLSGKSVLYWLKKENIALENLLVITDDLNIPFKSTRLKSKGSHGGHNGLRDIQDTLNTTQYNRFRFGIGNTFSKGKQIQFVLGEWDDVEKETLKELLQKSVNIIESFVLSGLSNTMNQFNN